MEIASHTPAKRRSPVDWSRWHFDIDTYLNRIVPAPPWHWVPRPISHFLGYRGYRPPRPTGNLVIAFWALVGAFCGVSVVMSVTMRVPSFQHHHAPSVIASMVSFVGIRIDLTAQSLIVNRAPRRCWNLRSSIHPLRNLEMLFWVKCLPLW